MKKNKQLPDKLDRDFLDFDRKHIYRSTNITRIPGLTHRKGGKTSYAEWAHVTGIFQTLIYQNLRSKTGNHTLDVGCGTGLLAIASEPFVKEGGFYTGIDVIRDDITFDRQHYPEGHTGFIHLDLHNPTYAGDQTGKQQAWPFTNEQFDLVTALSVWTHFREEDALFYLKEVHRVLKSGSRAIITFFILDEEYETFLSQVKKSPGTYHTTRQDLWIFDRPAYNSEHWKCPEWAKHPEDAIGITGEGLELLLKESGLRLVQYNPGNWKEKPGIYFQDVLIFEKP